MDNIQYNHNHNVRTIQVECVLYYYKGHFETFTILPTKDVIEY